MSGISTNRTNITLPSEVSQEILQKTQTESAIMRLARQIVLPGRGLEIPVITSDPTASWVGETAAKPVSNPGLSTKQMLAYKLAVIVPFSDEFRACRAPAAGAGAEVRPDRHRQRRRTGREVRHFCGLHRAEPRRLRRPHRVQGHRRSVHRYRRAQRQPQRLRPVPGRRRPAARRYGYQRPSAVPPVRR